MKSENWDWDVAVAAIRKDVWRYLSQRATGAGVELEASHLLQMQPAEVRRLAAVQFILSEPVAQLLDQMPSLMRRLATTTEAEEEWSATRVRGPINWGLTLGARASTGLPHMYVTSPARRAFQTPENEALVFALDAIRSVGRGTGWHRSESEGVGSRIRATVDSAERWLRVRSLTEIERRSPTPRSLRRVQSGRSSRRYQPALDVIATYRSFLARLDRNAIRKSIEEMALAASKDDVLLELLTAFQIERALKKGKWAVSYPGLVQTGQFLRATRAGVTLRMFYQQAPNDLAQGSIYRAVQKAHPFKAAGSLRPDFVLQVDEGGERRWILVEVKGVERTVEKSARAALLDLLAYRRAFDHVLGQQTSVYGLGVAWGRAMKPSVTEEVALCTPDTINQALALLLPAPTPATAHQQPAVLA
jgi:hypothetical protein